MLSIVNLLHTTRQTAYVCAINTGYLGPNDLLLASIAIQWDAFTHYVFNLLRFLGWGHLQCTGVPGYRNREK